MCATYTEKAQLRHFKQMCVSVSSFPKILVYAEFSECVFLKLNFQ